MITKQTGLDNEAVARLVTDLADAVVDRLRPMLSLPGWPAGRSTVSEPEAAAYLGIGPDYLRELRRSGRITYTAQGRRVTYTVRDLTEYLDSCRRSSNGQEDA